jgi:anti-anti-sigma factor
MQIEETMQNNTCVVRVTGRLDATTAPELDQAVTQIIGQGKHKMAFDLTHLEYVSSAGLRIFLVVAKKLKVLNGELSLAGLQGNIKEVLEISGFPSILPCYDSMDDLPA